MKTIISEWCCSGTVTRRESTIRVYVINVLISSYLFWIIQRSRRLLLTKTGKNGATQSNRTRDRRRAYPAVDQERKTPQDPLETSHTKRALRTIRSNSAAPLVLHLDRIPRDVEFTHRYHLLLRPIIYDDDDAI
ncbi:uncharacterized protein LOC109503720 [Harpegnathos saltator]|uniref:uncharacterized protein LOC109503720 n=1 Tax=Harpegnathos saltator TaxID=610380 RepID=UPI000DBEDE35|nr:uncharacterized protein LOC109503720 [Harpegnathos saltator]